MARNIYIHITPSPTPAHVKRTRDAKHDVSPLVAALMEAIAARQGKTGDAGFDESKVKRDEGGRFSAQQHTAAAEEHKKAAAEHSAKYDASGKAMSHAAHATARNAHEEAAELHTHAALAVKHGKTFAEHTANQAHAASAKAIGHSNALKPKGESSAGESKREELDRLVSNLAETEDPVAKKRDTQRANELKRELDGGKKPAAAASAATSAGSTGKPTSASAKGAKAATHELLSSGHPFSIDELMKATGCSNKSTLMTALSDLKSPKYAGKLGALSIKKNADGTFQIEKKAEGSTPKFPMSAHGEAKGTMHMGPGKPDQPVSQAAIEGAKQAGYAMMSLSQAMRAHKEAKTPEEKRALAKVIASKEEPGMKGRAPAAGGLGAPKSAPGKASNLEARIKKNQSLGMGPETAKPQHLGRELNPAYATPERPSITGPRANQAMDQMEEAFKKGDARGVMNTSVLGTHPAVEKYRSQLAKQLTGGFPDVVGATSKKSDPLQARTTQVNTNTPAGHNLLSSFLKHENAKAAAAKPATPAQLTAAKNKVGSIEMQIENLVRKGAGRSDGRLFDLRTRLAKAQNEHSRLLSTVPKK